jgi:hypothetical protein
MPWMMALVDWITSVIMDIVLISNLELRILGILGSGGFRGPAGACKDR